MSSSREVVATGPRLGLPKGSFWKSKSLGDRHRTTAPATLTVIFDDYWKGFSRGAWAGGGGPPPPNSGRKKSTTKKKRVLRAWSRWVIRRNSYRIET